MIALLRGLAGVVGLVGLLALAAGSFLLYGPDDPDGARELVGALLVACGAAALLASVIVGRLAARRRAAPN